MKNELVVPVVIAGVVGFFLGYLFAPVLYRLPMMSQSGNSRMMGTNVDRHFLEEMVPHHEGAIAMAELALRKSNNENVRKLSENIITSQKAEIEKMREWYLSWYGKELPRGDTSMGDMMGHGGMMGMTMEGMSGDMAALESAENFDLEFVRQMIPHHEMAVMMARMLAASTERAEMSQFARNIIEDQSREIRMMREWEAAWTK